MADGFGYDDLGCLGGPRLPLKSAINFRDLMNGKSFRFEIKEDDLIQEGEESESDDEDPRKPRAKKFYEDPEYQWQPDDNEIKLDECLGNFNELEKTMEPIEECGRIKKLVLKPGNSHKVTENSKVIIHYAAFVDGGIDPFDKTFGERSRPRGLFLGGNEIFIGLRLSLLTMTCGEISRFMIYPDFAFGQLGCPPRIPGGVRVVYTIEMLRFVSGTTSDVAFMSGDQRAQLSFKEIVNAALKCKSEGNAKYASQDYKGALRCYTQGILILEDYPTGNESDNNVREGHLPELCVNKAQCLLKLQLPAKACVACKLGLRYTDPDSKPKLLIRFAEAKFMLQAFDDALRLCKEAMRIFKAGSALMPKHSKLFEKIKAALDEQKQVDTFLSRKMLGLSTQSESETSEQGKQSEA